MKRATIADAEPIAYMRERAAELIGLSVTALDRLIKSRELIASRVGGRVLIPRWRLHELIRRGEGVNS